MCGNKKLNTGEVVAWQKGKMMAPRWRDKRDVCLMSIVHNTSNVMVRTKGGKEIMKPQVVIDYNNTMGGVDRADQAMTFYPAMRKQKISTTRRSSGIFLSNACGMPTSCKKKSDKPVFHSDLIWKVAERIFVKHQTPSMAVNRDGHRAFGVVNPECLTGRHFMDYIPPTEKKSAPTRMCVVCCLK
ncbi:Hypothetical predicted protein [Pelobates cultripes]|uniref:PiggyBac transposable element-derived protein domain-containing protein n=1 Tax=Pelobates cultripes TaxID=61616 RepID=A0AAD1RC55_PELCU|nr:Hypothetical predicted protein [Pelobates cultripes]